MSGISREVKDATDQPLASLWAGSGGRDDSRDTMRHAGLGMGILNNGQTARHRGGLGGMGGLQLCGDLHPTASFPVLSRLVTRMSDIVIHGALHIRVLVARHYIRGKYIILK